VPQAEIEPCAYQIQVRRIGVNLPQSMANSGNRVELVYDLVQWQTYVSTMMMKPRIAWRCGFPWRTA